MNSRSQAGQDLFILKCLQNKTYGTFLEIGSHDPEFINNTYVLEKEYHWRGIMVEYNTTWLESYERIRPTALHIMKNAIEVNYLEEFYKIGFPKNIDYLQIDLEVIDNTSLTTLEKLNSQVMDDYKFAVITFEHDIWRGDYYNTRNSSRNILDARGYVRVFSDVLNGNNPFEDWYVHPELVDMELINKLKTDESLEWTDIIKRIQDIN